MEGLDFKSFNQLKYKDPNYIEVFEILMKHLGIEKEEAVNSYLSPSIKDFNDPFLLKDMDVAIDLFEKTMNNKGKIILFGDYDADGVTSTALFVKVMKYLNYDNFNYFIPDRQKDGYGISKENLNLVSEEADLIITADTGIKELSSLKLKKIPVIVTDHHDPIIGSTKEILYDNPDGILIETGKEFMVIPDVEAVINPKRIDCNYPNECLAGVAVLYKFFQALFKKMNLPVKDLIYFLDIVAIGLVADLVPQFDKKHQDTEVRLMTALGLQIMNSNPDVWTTSFMNVHRKNRLEFNDLGFSIGPNLNAAGRMGSAYPAVEFLIEEDPEKSIELANNLKEINELRKKTQKEAIDSVSSKIHHKNIAIDILDEKFDTGVAGLVASAVSDKNNSPAIIFCVKEVDGEKMLTGSCRSIDGVSIIDALIEVEKSIGNYRYGGHEQAAGLTINYKDFNKFKVSIERVMDKIDMDSLRGKLSFDIELPLNLIDFEIVGLFNSSYVNLNLMSKENTLYSPPTPNKNPNWSRVYLEKSGVRYKAMLWNNSELLLEEYANKNIDTIDISYQASYYNGEVSISINDYLIN